ncbi:MAG: hypoxanthine phosphoribosyltransferase [Victivallales bacterium]|jgi:hypoxanthine phosphoribosyltransferase
MRLPEIETLISERRIRRRVADLGREISSCYRGKHLTVIFVSNGAIIFVADLIRSISIPMQIDSISASSYRGTRSSGKVTIDACVKVDIRNRHVLVVDDILDTGRTLAEVISCIEKHHPKDIRTCVLLEKPSRRVIPVKADFVGFEIPDVFAVGYGLDYNEYCRNLPFVGHIGKIK